MDTTTRSFDTKTCPQCAEEIKAAAKICRFCRYEFPSEVRSIGRIPCSDGACIGTMNENGVCRVCGRGTLTEEEPKTFHEEGYKMARPWYKKPLLIVFGVLAFLLVLSQIIHRSGERSPGEGNLAKDETRPKQKPNPTAIPSFRIAVKHKGLGITYAVLVPENINREQLKALIIEFKKARREGFISKMIPPTTPGGLGGDYNAVEIYVFSEPNWATEIKFKKWLDSSQLSPEDAIFDKEYVKHIRAYYLYALTGEEIGSIGYSGEEVKSSDYEKLFWDKPR